MPYVLVDKLALCLEPSRGQGSSLVDADERLSVTSSRFLQLEPAAVVGIEEFWVLPALMSRVT